MLCHKIINTSFQRKRNYFVSMALQINVRKNHETQKYE